MTETLNFNQFHIKQIAVIVLMDILNMNDDRISITYGFLGPHPAQGYHGNLMLRNNKGRTNSVIMAA